jgi:hypothetical protein
MVREIAFVLALAGAPFTASAKDVKIGQTSLNLVAPLGQCELREDQPDDGQLLKVLRDVQAGNDLLAAYADCQQLADYRSGKRSILDDFANYVMPKSAMNAKLPPDAVKQVCDVTRKKGEQIYADASRKASSLIEQVVKGIKADEPLFLGVVAEDATACYLATVQKTNYPNGERTQAWVTAMLAARGKFISYNVYTAYVSSATVAGLLAKHKNNVAAVLRANN